MIKRINENLCCIVPELVVLATAEHVLFQQIPDKVKGIADVATNCFILFILRHGGHHEFAGAKEEVLYGTDGRPFPKKEILRRLHDDECPNLKGKPRVVFLVSCRGGLFHFVSMKCLLFFDCFL